MEELIYPFKTKPYEHQRTALNRSWERKEYALFMEMGTGKSKVLIDNIAVLYDRGYINAALIIAPKGVYRNWEMNELPIHLPDHILVNMVVWNPTNTKTQQRILDTLFEYPNEDLKILIMNVEALSTKKGAAFAGKFLNAHKALMAVDESTTIKNPKAKRTKSILKLSLLAKYRRILTGSPVTKSPLDLYAQCEFLDPVYLGYSSYFSFRSRYAIIQQRSVATHSFQQVVGYQNLEELNKTLNKFSYRVLKEHCLDLPEKVYIRRTIQLTKEQKEVYDDLKKWAIATLEDGDITTTNVITQLLRLQQVTCGYAKFDDGTFKELPNNRIDELLAVLEETSGKAIIWANYIYDIKQISKALGKAYGSDSYGTYFGETSDDDRQRLVANFQDPNHPCRFFVGQVRTGGYGLTLTQAATVVYYSNTYDLEVRMQSEDRAHRIGQVNRVTYIDILAERTVDEKIVKALRKKINLATAVMGEAWREWLV